jgi:hypothetical protein
MDSRDASDEFARQVELLGRKLARLLAGRHAALQGAVLADLTATWLKGYVVEDDPDATERAREDVLALQVETIKSLLRLPP